MTKLLHETKRNKDDVLSYVKSTLEDSKTRMIDLHRDWALSLAWVRGQQNTDFDAKSRKWRKSKVNPWQTRLIANMLLPIVRNKVSRSMIFRNVWDAIPATPDQEDIEIAKVSTKILEDVWVKHKMPMILLRTLFWRSITGNGFIKVGWDKDAGDPIQVETRLVEDETLQQFMAMIGFDETPETVEVKPGELFLNIVSPFNLTFDPHAMMVEDSEIAIESNLRSLDWIVQKYGNKWKDKLSENIDTEQLISPWIYQNNNENINKKGVLVHELYIKPGGRFKKGLFSLIANDEFLEVPRDYPFEHGRLPYGHFGEVTDPLSLWHYSLADQARPNQARYNNILSRLTDNINQMSNLQWTVPRRSNVTSVTNKPGGIIRYDGNLAPQPTRPASIPVYVENTLERTRRDMQDTVSFHNVSQAQNEPGIRSGRAILALKESDDSVENPVQMLLDDGLITVGRLVIETINQHATEEQIIQIVGDFGEMETITYTSEMLTGENKGDYFKVRVKTFGRQTLSRGDRLEQVSTFLNIGILDVVRDRELILNMIDTADTSQIFEEEEQDRARQWREIKAIANGEEIAVLVGENHEIHMKMIKKFYASSRREKVSPEALQKIQQHYLQHLQIQAAEIVQAQMIVQSAIQGVQDGPTRTQSNGNRTQSRGNGANSPRTGVNTSR